VVINVHKGKFLLQSKTNINMNVKTYDREEIRFFAAIFEIAAFILLIIWFATYYPLFRTLQFQLHVHRKVTLDEEALVAKLNDKMPPTWVGYTNKKLN